MKKEILYIRKLFIFSYKMDHSVCAVYNHISNDFDITRHKVSNAIESFLNFNCLI